MSLKMTEAFRILFQPKISAQHNELMKMGFTIYLPKRPETATMN